MKPFRLVLVLAAILVSCSAPATPLPQRSPSPVVSPQPSPSPAISFGGPPPSVTGTVTAGPVCPAERNPPDPQCAPRPVAGAVIVATDSGGQDVGQATTATDGSYVLTVSETGTVEITGLPVAGLMGVPTPVTVTVAFPSAIEHVDLEYDTGIR